ncbi:MAG TPA: hypothetical protein VIQ97_00795 [Prevotella sp.]
MGNGHISMDCRTDYPYGEQIEITLTTSKKMSIPLYFRLPSWCNKPTIKVNGKKISVGSANGFARVYRTWNTGDKISLHFPMHVSLTQGRETPYPRAHYFNGGFGTPTPAYKDSVANQPYEYVNYGPLVYALPFYDVDENKVVPGQPYNYALDIHPDRIKKDVRILRSPMPVRWRWNIDEAPVKLQVKAVETNWQPSITHPLPQQPVEASDKKKITLVPYSCARFHVTMFPVTRRTWTKD